MPRPVYKAPPPVYIFNWTGCYAGGNIGGLWVHKEFTGLGFIAPFGTTFSGDASGALGGLQAGCNYQFAGGWVVGIQADYDWTNASVDRNGVLFPGLTESYRVNSVGSLTGRLGYGWDRFLGYVKGGVAWERDSLTFAVPALTASFSDTRNGWTIGIGGEYAFTNWITGFVEYDYYNFGTRTDSVVCGPFACFVGGPGLLPFDIKETKSVLKVGLNFLFGGVGNPVYGRY
jgi:outer membrane immunogenic protein